jgi:hypothetical protein
MRRIAALAALFCALVSPALGAGIVVHLDEAQTISFDRSIATLYVGNPAIADVTMIDSTHAFVIGKAFGTTNLLALDGRGNQISDRPVAVIGRPDAMVTLNLGPSQLTYACGPAHCEVTPTQGDAKDPYDTWYSQETSHQDLGNKNATAAH